MGPGQDGEQPATRCRWIPEPLEAGERAQRGVLQQVLRIGLVAAAEPERGPIQRIQMLGEDFLERPLRALRSFQLSVLSDLA
jgi:hypothetical protein